MKRFLAVLLTAALALTVCLTLTGCDSPKVRVESVLNLTTEFKGSRTVTVVYPLNADIDAIKDELLNDCPSDVEGAAFTYLGATENGYSFELKLSFENLAQYEAQVSAILGRDANAVLARRDTVMFTGTHMAEDFDVSDLIGWVIRDTETCESTKDYSFEYPYNKVNIGADSYDAGSTVNVSEGKGVTVNSVEIKTYNEKASLLGRTFDRSFVFSIPADTYTEYKTKINEFFDPLNEVGALITDTREGNSVLFTVTFEGLSLSELETTTATVLDSDGVSVFYGDKGDTSTPLFEGRVLEETLDTLSFNGKEGAAPALKYTYTVPTNAVQGEGAYYKDGGWETIGSWDDGAYRMEDASGTTHLRIYDGRQYSIDGVNIDLLSLGDGKFRRTTAFLYPVADGFEGPVYAEKFFYARNAEATAENDGEHIVCSVVTEGTEDEINAALEKIFGKGNYISFERKSGALSDKTSYTDSIDLRELLSVENASVAVRYTARAENGENIVTLKNGDSETAYKNSQDSAITLENGVGSVGYHGVIPKAFSIILYIIFGVAALVVTTLLAYRMLVPPIRRERGGFRPITPADDGEPVPTQEPQPQEAVPSGAPQQTTTFSIFELGVLSRNKKYADEIDRDVQNRMEEQRRKPKKKRTETQKPTDASEPQPAEPQPSELQSEPELPSELNRSAPRTIEILEALDTSNQEEPEPVETTDPMELLNLMKDGEDEDA